MMPIESTSAATTRASGQPGAVASADPAFEARATKAAVQFEGFFISHMLHQMRSGTREMAGEDSVFKDPVNRDMLDLADTLMADKLAGQRAFGIADAILRQLLPAAAPAQAGQGAVAVTLSADAQEKFAQSLNKRK